MTPALASTTRFLPGNVSSHPGTLRFMSPNVDAARTATECSASRTMRRMFARCPAVRLYGHAGAASPVVGAEAPSPSGLTFRSSALGSTRDGFTELEVLGSASCLILPQPDLSGARSLGAEGLDVPAKAAAAKKLLQDGCAEFRKGCRALQGQALMEQAAALVWGRQMIVFLLASKMRFLARTDFRRHF